MSWVCYDLVGKETDSQFLTTTNNIISARWLDEQQDQLRAVIAAKLGAEDSHAVDDVWQELCMAVEKNAGVSNIREPNAWVRQIINHKVADYLRLKQRSERLKGHVAEAMEQPVSKVPFDWVLELEDRQQVRDALMRCAPENRVVLKLKYFSESSVNEVAEALKITTKAAEYRLHRAREEFRTFITELREES